MEYFKEPEFKTLLDTTSGNFLALNSTLLIGVVAVLVVLAVAALVASGSFSPAKIVQRYGQEYNQFYDTVDAYSQNRYRRSAANGKVDLFYHSIPYFLILKLLYGFLLILLFVALTVLICRFHCTNRKKQSQTRPLDSCILDYFLDTFLCISFADFFSFLYKDIILTVN